ncbi:hypothetical protein ACH4U7_27715 [Streptomyces sp. NPDC020845]|uniref:hypothetical protein n=1 Tax=Streptomyces sp. NPDC020845 TaxID=3365096 RepID=UPI0037BD3D17
MEIWTDGTLVVQACEETGTVRVLRDSAVIGESTAEHPLGRRTPLAVDTGADRIWAGHRLQEFRLSDMSSVATHEGPVLRVAGLGDGRLAAVLPSADGVCRLAVGQPGRWEREVTLDDLGQAVPGLAATGEHPFTRAIGGDPTLTVTEHGLVVADGRRGVVAHFTHDLEPLGLWHAGGADETELTGYATARGILVTARWAARESHVGWLTPDGPEHLLNSYGAFAIPADDNRFWLVGDFEVALVDHGGNTITSASAGAGRVRAAHASGSSCTMSSTTSVRIATATDEGIAVRKVDVGGLSDIAAVFDPDVEGDRSFYLSLLAAIAGCSVRHGYSSHRDEDNHLHILVQEIRPGMEQKVEKALRTAGAIHVDTVDPARSPSCCRR